MIAARLAGGNLFFGFLGWWEISGRGFLEHSEQLGALGFFLRGFFVVGILFFGGRGVCFGLKVLEKIKK